MLNLTALARPFHYRAVRDSEGWPVIPGRLGQIEPHDGHAHAVYTTRPRVFGRNRLWETRSSIGRSQTGGQEMRPLFPPERLVEVATGIGARLKRQLTSEAARKRSGGLQRSGCPSGASGAVFLLGSGLP